MTSTLTQNYNLQTALWAMGRALAQAVVIVALLLAALWVARWAISGSALVLANPAVVLCVVGIAVYGWLTYPKGQAGGRRG